MLCTTVCMQKRNMFETYGSGWRNEREGMVGLGESIPDCGNLKGAIGL